MSEPPLPAPEIIDWLLKGDVSIQYQTLRDLLGEDRPELQERIPLEGWGARLLARRNPDGSWGRGFYQPKWTSSHYTLLDLKGLGTSSDHPLIRQSVERIALYERGPDGGVNPSRMIRQSDVCINGLFLSYACHFAAPPEALHSVVDFILAQQMPDGGFNCRKNRSGASHSSLHSTLSVLEGLTEYARSGYTYRLHETGQAAADSCRFILQHRLFRSDHTGEIIHPDFLKLVYPARWKYNILRALDCLRAAGIPFSDEMSDALAMLGQKRGPDGRWRLNAAHPGAVHFVMERPGEPSRWITLLALRVFNHYAPGMA